MVWPTAASGATSARAPAARMTASGACASCARAAAQSSCSRPGPLLKLLRRPDREEAAQPFPAGHGGAVVQHRRLQPDLQVLPELGHLEGPAARPAAGRGRAETI